MSGRPIHLLIFTDLDGTLLDHDSYSAKPADRLVRQLADQTLAQVIPVTSKTHAETLRLQQDLGLAFTACVTENGSVIHGPEENVPGRRPSPITLGATYAEILDRIGRLPAAFRRHFTGFADMSVREIADVTGLALDAASRARERQATEPFLWSGPDSDLESLAATVRRTDLRIQRGGRFYHLTGLAAKEQAMDHIVRTVAGQKPDREIISVALGDGPNDLAMIEAADYGVIMPNPQGVTITSASTGVRTAPAPGPEGWVAAVKDILAELGLNLRES